MKKLILVLLLSLPILGFSQKLSKDFTVTKSKPFKVVDAISKEYIKVGNGITISVKTAKKITTIQRFDANKMEEDTRNEYKDFPKYSKFQKLLKVDGRLYYIFEAYNKKPKTFSVYSREINIEDGSFKESQKLFTTRGKIVAPRDFNATQTMWGGSTLPKFEVITSFDKSKVLIRYRNKPLNKRDSKNYDILGFYVFDNQLNEIWNKEAVMPHTEKEMNNLAYTVTSNGTAFMLARINKSKTFELITVDASGLNNKKLDIKEGLIFDNFYLKESADKNIIAAGYYGNGTELKVNWNGDMSRSKNINGLYVFEIGQDGNILKKNDYPFSIGLIKKYLSNRQKKKANKKEGKGKAGISDLVLREFTVNADGSMVIVGEVYYTKKELYITSMTLVTHFSNIVITKIDKDGNLVWEKKLPKNQAAPATAYQAVGSLGIAYTQGEGAHYIMFVDNKKNALAKMDLPAKPHKGGFGGYLTAYKIDDATGSIEKHLVLDLTNIKGIKARQFYITRIFEALDKTFLLEVYIKGKKDMMVKMKLD